MGCDIHLYAEHRRRDDGYWFGFGGQMNPGRDYALFGTLAGVRGEGPPVVEPRGYPKDAGWRARGDYEYAVVADDEKLGEWLVGGENACSIADAERWRARWLEGPLAEPRHGLVGKVADPDAHTESWLTLAEFKLAIRNREAQHRYPVDPEYRALVAALDVLEDAGLETRVVFWFDN